VLRFFGFPIPSTMTGASIRPVPAPVPFALHSLHLEQRRIRLPLELGEVAFVSAIGIVAMAVIGWLLAGGGVHPALGRTLRFLSVAAAAFPIPLLLGGLLPTFVAAVVVPFIVVVTLAIAVVALRARSDPLQPFFVVGVLGLGALGVAAVVAGGRSFAMPLFGGTMFDGVRFYGLPNAFLCLALGSALFVAWRLRPWSGFVLLVAVALFAGLPRLGADLGGAVTLLVAAGLWWPLASRGRIDLRGAWFAALTVVAGTAFVLLVNRYLPGTPTHLTRFVEQTGTGGAVATAVDRLRIGWHQLNRVPAAYLPMVGLVGVLVLAVRQPGVVGQGLRVVDRRWREVLLVLPVCGLVSFVVNDTGVASAGPVFLSAMSALTYAVMAARLGMRSEGLRALTGTPRATMRG
jgi:hypothetical protein